MELHNIGMANMLTAKNPFDHLEMVMATLSSTMTTNNQNLIDFLKPSSTIDSIVLGFLIIVALTLASQGKLWDRPDPRRKIFFERPQHRLNPTKNSHQQNIAGGPSQPAQDVNDRNIASVIIQTGAEVVIFWGSQSGRAEGFATRVARDFERKFGKRTLLADLSDYTPQSILKIPSCCDGKVLVVFILATYGDGDPSDNAMEFCEWIGRQPTYLSDEKGVSSSSLDELRYVALGLGNSSYKFYNRVVDLVTTKLNGMGAQALLPSSKADDAQGRTEEDFTEWKERIFRMVIDDLGYVEREDTSSTFVPSIRIHEVESTPDPTRLVDDISQNGTHIPSTQCSPIKPIKIATSHVLTASSRSQPCIHLEMDIADQPHLVYKTGDHMGIWPRNTDDEVSRLLRMLGATEKASILIEIHPVNGDTPRSKLKLPSPTTREALFRSYLEIAGPINREMVLGLSHFAPSSISREYLAKLSRDKAAFDALIARKHLTLGRLLELVLDETASIDADGIPTLGVWNRLPLEWVVENLKPMQPRYYSISSSSVVSPRRVALTVGVEKTLLANSITADEDGIPGLSSNYLFAKTTQNQRKDSIATTAGEIQSDKPSSNQPTQEGDKEEEQPRLLAHIRRTPFKLPLRSTNPIIMFATGTGIAPFRAFLAERQRIQETMQRSTNTNKEGTTKPAAAVGEMILFFGCRCPEEDFLYREEIENWISIFQGSLSVVVAVSRPGGGNETRILAKKTVGTWKRTRGYVQDSVVGQEANDVVRLIEEEDATVYICGKAGMARGVDRAVGKAFEEINDWETERWEEFRRALRRRKKWQEDVWG